MAEEIKSAPAPSPAPAAPAASPSAAPSAAPVAGSDAAKTSEIRTTTYVGTAPAGGPEQPSPWSGMLTFFLPLMIIFYLFMIRPENKRRKQQQDMLAALKKNDKVVLASIGLYGTVTDIDGDDVTLLIDPKKDVKIKVRREAVAQIVSNGAEEKK